MTALADLDLVGLSDAIADGSVSAEVAVRASLDRARDHASLNAVTALHADRAIEDARACDRERAQGKLRGPLHGVPMAHKDMFHRAGQISGCGSRIMADHVADTTGTVLARLDMAGAIDIGRLHMAEFAMGPTGHNAHLGRCGNPWHPDAISGGSSSGSGAAVGARIVTAALGSDTGGSVRLPAAFCGAVGLKTTQHRLPMDGVMALSHSLDTIGPIARSSRDIARLMTVLTDGEEDFESDLGDRLSGLTIGVPQRYYGEGLDTPVAAALTEARVVLMELGARVIDMEMADHGDLTARAAQLWLPEAAARHLHWLEERPQDYGDQVRNRLLEGTSTLATLYLRAIPRRAADLAQILDGPLRQCDLLLTPVCRTIVPLAQNCAASGGPEMHRVVGEISALTRTISYLGLPAITTPVGRDPRDVPIGMQLIGRPNAEALLIRVSHAFEQVTPWLKQPLPPLPLPSQHP